jgi:hypothetical protein
LQAACGQLGEQFPGHGGVGIPGEIHHSRGR